MKIILEDSRQQRGKHDNVNLWLAAHGIEIRRTKLYVGDYTLPTNQSVCIDTKYGLQEIYGNIVGAQHERFIRELKAAHDTGIRLIVLVEQSGIKSLQDVAKWKNPRAVRWQKIHDAQIRGAYRGVKLSKNPPVSSDRLAKAMQTIAERYGCEWMFCDKANTAKRICELLGIEVQE